MNGPLSPLVSLVSKDPESHPSMINFLDKVGAFFYKYENSVEISLTPLLPAPQSSPEDGVRAVEVVQEAAHAVAAAELEVVEVVELWRGQEREVVAGVGDGGGDERHAVPGHSNMAIRASNEGPHEGSCSRRRPLLGPSPGSSSIEQTLTRSRP